MLQIISGKFYGDVDTYKSEGKAILYSNYHWHGLIETKIVNMEPIDTRGSVKAFLISYINRLSKGKDGESFLVRIGDDEIVRQFQLLCSFGLEAYFHPDRTTVELNTRSSAKNMGDQYVPSLFLPRYFESEINGKNEEIEYFSRFMDQVIGLGREDYKNVISSLSNFFDALEVVNQNLDLAYTMLVYSLEALSKKYSDYTPSWNDYDGKAKKALESIFKDLSSENVEGIKKVLITSSHLKLQQNFINFVCENLSDSYFEEEALDLGLPLKKSEVKRVLKNAYITRSGYVHELKKITKQLKMPSIAQDDTFHWGKEPYLTFAGLVRLVRHVITNFIWSRQTLDSEETNWDEDLPGTFYVQLAPELWIWRGENFSPENAISRFSGVLSELESTLLYNKHRTLLPEVIIKIEEHLPQVKKDKKITMLCLYLLYTISVPEEHKPVNHDKILDEYGTLLEICNIETMITLMLANHDWEWKFEEVNKTYEQFNTQRFGKKTLEIPTTFEIALLCAIGNLCTEDTELRMSWYKKALLEAAGKELTQNYLKDCINRAALPSLEFLISGCKETSESEE